MTELYSSGRIVDVVLLAVAVEFVVLSVLHARTGRGIAPSDLGVNLLAALFLLLALRNALFGYDWRVIAAFLGASFPAHLLDLRRRWNNPARSPETAAETGIAPRRGDR